MFGKWSFASREAQPEAFVPYLGHASETSILDDSGTLHAVLAVEGLPWETAAASALNG
ncbi:type IV secretion system protein VirB4, partial [Belnapia rosea]